MRENLQPSDPRSFEETPGHWSEFSETGEFVSTRGVRLRRNAPAVSTSEFLGSSNGKAFAKKTPKQAAFVFLGDFCSFGLT